MVMEPLVDLTTDMHISNIFQAFDAEINDSCPNG
jgi:hypothetical protein